MLKDLLQKAAALPVAQIGMPAPQPIGQAINVPPSNNIKVKGFGNNTPAPGVSTTPPAPVVYSPADQAKDMAEQRGIANQEQPDPALGSIRDTGYQVARGLKQMGSNVAHNANAVGGYYARGAQRVAQGALGVLGAQRVAQPGSAASAGIGAGAAMAPIPQTQAPRQIALAAGPAAGPAPTNAAPGITTTPPPQTMNPYTPAGGWAPKAPTPPPAPAPASAVAPGIGVQAPSVGVNVPPPAFNPQVGGVTGSFMSPPAQATQPPAGNYAAGLARGTGAPQRRTSFAQDYAAGTARNYR